MKSNFLSIGIFACLGFALLNDDVSAAEPMECMAQYLAHNTNTRPAPGLLATHKDTPCLLSTNLINRGRGIGQANGFLILKAPKNGKVDIVNASSFIFTPRKGFTGKDLLVMRFKLVQTRGAAVRFVVKVD